MSEKKHRIAMGNTKEEVKQAADDVTDANDAAGIPFELLKQGLSSFI
ncbi:HAD hydrolase family protein [Paraliobacillus ryukyuensis]|nr:HAD hydrolase family protein [Paraliobacillus ryukyuensis]